MKYFPKEHRGTLNGIIGIFSVFGVVCVMIVGGYLFDAWDRSGPFILYDAMLGFSILWILWIYVFRIRNTKFDDYKDDAIMSKNLKQNVELF